MRKYRGIEIGRVIFAILIPLLHIPFENNCTVDVIRQYVSRLGVPFFFVVSGMFLFKSIEKYGRAEALKRYLIRVGRVLLIWLLIYLPFLIKWADSYLSLLQKIIFKTPAFLWYLTSLMFAAVPFCLVKNRKALYGCSVVLYLLGTIYSDTYKWLVGGVPQYEAIFLTTRNGIFFGLPLLCVGEFTWGKEKISLPLFIISGLALIAEITFVGAHAGKMDDRSMYLMLPLFIFALVLLFRDWNPKMDGLYLGGISSAIYVMQYGIIAVGTMALRKLNLTGTNAMWLVYITVVVIPVVVYWILRNKRIVKIIF